MPSVLRKTFLIIFSLLFAHTSSALYIPNKKAETVTYHPQRLIVKLKTEFKDLKLDKVGGQITTGLAEFDQLNQKYSVVSQKKILNSEITPKKNNLSKPSLNSNPISDLSGWYILEFPQRINLLQAQQDYQKLNQVQYVELDYKLQLFQAPNDSLFSDQWNLNNTGQAYRGVLRVEGDSNDLLVMKNGVFDADVDALEAFQRNLQKITPLVGVLDTGGDTLHPDLKANLWTNPDEIPNNGLDDDHNGYVDDLWGWDFSGDDSLSIIEDNDPADFFGHGTHVSGIIGAVRDNGRGISGVGIESKILPVKIFPNIFYSVAAQGIIYATQNGVDIINMSWGGIFPSKILEEAIQYAYGQGVVLVASSGNIETDQPLIIYPAVYEEVISVGATNSSDQRTSFSNYGNFLDVVAPGEDVLSLRASGTDMYADGYEPNVHIVAENYYLADGTSMAAPHVAAVAASLISASSGISNQKIREIIQNSADDLTDPNGLGEFLPGWDQFSGFGRVNLDKAFDFITGYVARITYPQNFSLVSGELQIIGTASGDSFQNYQLEYGEGLNPGTWNLINSSNLNVTDDTLGSWNTSGLDGIYSLRLKLTASIFHKIVVLVANSQIVEITFPADNDSINTQVEIKGTALAPNFSSYKLEYAPFTNPTLWQLISSSTLPVWDSVLGFWSTAHIANGLYLLLLTLMDDSDTLSDTTLIYINNYFLSGWPKKLEAPGSISPAVEDLDGDGEDEIIVGTRKGVYVYKADGTIAPGWPQDTTLDFRSAVAIADLDGNGKKEIIISSDSTINVYQADGRNHDKWSRQFSSGLEFWAYPTPIVADLESFGSEEGTLEILLVNPKGNIYAWRREGIPVGPAGEEELGVLISNPWGLEEPPNWGALIPLIVADLDADGQNEVCLGLGSYFLSGGVFIFNKYGGLITQPSLNAQLSLVSGMAASDLDRDGELEIIAVGADANNNVGVWVVNKDGTVVPGWPQKLNLNSNGWISGYPAIGDLNSDGLLEVVITIFSIDQARVYAWQEDGTPLTSPGNPWLAKVDGTLGNPVLADVDGDGYVDVVARGGWIIPGSGPELIYAWKYTGEMVENWPFYTPASIREVSSAPFTPVIKDLNHNGKLDMVLVSDDQGLVIWELPTDYDSSLVPWGTFLQNSQRRGILPRFTTDVKPHPRPPVPVTFELNQNYPNPFNSNTTIQYSLPKTSQVQLVIYNILGQKVKTLADEIQTPGYKTIIWDGKNDSGQPVASGLYFYTLRTSSFTHTRKMVMLK